MIALDVGQPTVEVEAKQFRASQQIVGKPMVSGNPNPKLIAKNM